LQAPFGFTEYSIKTQAYSPSAKTCRAMAEQDETHMATHIRQNRPPQRPPTPPPSKAELFAHAEMEKHKTNHLLHAFLSVLTVGLWLIVWLPISIRNTHQRNLIARDYGIPPEINTGYFVIIFLLLLMIGDYLVYSNRFARKLPEIEGPIELPAKQETSWIYAKIESPMGRSSILTATTYSLNEIEFGPPYEGGQRAVLTLRKNFNNSHDVYFGLPKGRFQCNDRTCGITARFDSGLEQFFKASPAQNESAPGVYLRNADIFIQLAEAADEVSITAYFLNAPPQTFQFDTRNLRW
jgi:hypothetical protein